MGPQGVAKHLAGPRCAQNKPELVQLDAQPLLGAGWLSWQEGCVSCSPTPSHSPPGEAPCHHAAARCPGSLLKWSRDLRAAMWPGFNLIAASSAAFLSRSLSCLKFG